MKLDKNLITTVQTKQKHDHKVCTCNKDCKNCKPVELMEKLNTIKY